MTDDDKTTDEALPMTDETTKTEQDAPEATDPDATEVEATDPDATDGDTEPTPVEPKTFDAEYVAKLRDEAARYRTRAKRADALAAELFTLKVQQLGILADPTDLAYDEALLEDPDALQQAAEALIERKPHLASRRPRGSIGQGATTPVQAYSLMDALKAGV